SVDLMGDVLLSARADIRAPVTAAPPGRARTATADALAVSRRGDLAAVVRRGGDVELWELPRLRLRLLLSGSQRGSLLTPQVALSDDGNQVAVVVNGELIVEDTHSGRTLAGGGEPRLPSLTDHGVVQVRFGADGRLLVTTFDQDPYEHLVLRVINLAS